jgi:hypothetical protein
MDPVPLLIQPIVAANPRHSSSRVQGQVGAEASNSKRTGPASNQAPSGPKGMPPLGRNLFPEFISREAHVRHRLLLLIALLLVLTGSAPAQSPDPRAWLALTGIRFEQESNDVVVSGRLVSQAPRVVWDIHIGFTAYDQDNYPVAHGGTWFHSIAPGEEIPFEARAGSLNQVHRIEAFVRSAEQDPP